MTIIISYFHRNLPNNLLKNNTIMINRSNNHNRKLDRGVNTMMVIISSRIITDSANNHKRHLHLNMVDSFSSENKIYFQDLSNKLFMEFCLRLIQC